MPPSSYTEAGLAAYMVTALSNVGKLLSWDAATPEITEAVHETLFSYGVSDIASATEPRKLRAMARVQAWAAACSALAAFYDHKADGGEFDREKLQAHALKMLAEAKDDVAALPPEDGGSAVVEPRYSGPVTTRARW